MLMLVVIIHSVLSDDSFRNCYSKFLQTSALDEADQTCQNLYINHTAEFRNEIMLKSGPNQNLTCIYSILDKYKINNMYLRGVAQQYLMKNFTADKFEDEIEESMDTVLTASKVLCGVDELHKKTYEDLFEINNENEIDENDAAQNSTHNELCVLKYMIDNGIIDNEKFTFSTQDENVTDCENANRDLEDLFKEFVTDSSKISDSFFGLSTTKANECTSRRFKSEKTFPKLYSLRVIMKQKLNDEQKNELKQNYIEWTASTLIYMFECMQFI